MLMIFLRLECIILESSDMLSNFPTNNERNLMNLVVENVCRKRIYSQYILFL